MLCEAEKMRHLGIAELEEHFAHWKDMVWFNICAQDDAAWERCFDWLAQLVQAPGEKSRRSLVLLGDQGLGKGLFVTMIMNMLGAGICRTVQMRDLGAHFNDVLGSAVFLFVDEANRTKGIDTQHAESTLKQLVTETQVVIRKKYQDTQVMPNFAHVVIASNRRDAVLQEEGDRRFWILPVTKEIDPATDAGRDFFAKVEPETRDVKALAALYLLLSRRPLANVPWHLPLKTKIGWETQYRGLKPEIQFVYQWFLHESLFDGDYEPDNDLATSRMLADQNYPGGAPLVADLGRDMWARPGLFFPKDIIGAAWLKRFPETRQPEGAPVWVFLHSLSVHIPQERRRVNMDMDYVPGQPPKKQMRQWRLQCFQLPPLEELRAAFVARVGGATDPRIFGEWQVAH